MTPKLGLSLLCVIGVGSVGAALQQCDASLWKCFCDRDRCNTPICREADRRAPACDCRYGHFETTWTPWAAYCNQGSCVSRGCRSDAATGTLVKPQPMYAPPATDGHNDELPKYNAADPQLFISQPESGALQFPQHTPGAGTFLEEESVPSGAGQFFDSPQTAPPQRPMPNAPGRTIPWPPGVVPAPMPPMPQSDRFPFPAATPPIAVPPSFGPSIPMPNAVNPAPLPAAPNPAPMPQSIFVPPSPSDIPNESVFHWNQGQVQPTTHWNSQTGSGIHLSSPSVGVPVNGPGDARRWRVMQGFQGPQQMAVSQPFSHSQP